MTCDDARSKLTAYLDGELEDDRGSAIRGHLRGCDACRALSEDEAALRDGLRGLPPLDPPNALWASIQARLAAEEVADSERPAWRRALGRLLDRWRPLAPQLALGSMAIAIAVVVLAVRYRDSHDVPGHGVAFAMPQLPQPVAPVQPQVEQVVPNDVTAELAADRSDRTARYQRVVAGLVEDTNTARAKWDDDRKAVFDAKLAAFDRDLSAAPEGRARDKIYRSMIHYLQNAAIRDVVSSTSLADTQGGAR